ncbi:DUF1861 family protein [Bacillaceae bacterium Marseille-Q3522]|nr:DUF1861 family protein [Bacillaceae bacterium Marseille-Q3522]
MVYKVKELLNDYQQRNAEIKTKKLYFTGVGGKDVYNITAPFEDDGQMVIAGRVEARDTELSEVIFFVEKNGVWTPRGNTKSYLLQDPFVSKIRGQLVFGGVEVFPNPEVEGHFLWRTVFYKGDNINQLTHFANGPIGMKDIRLFEYNLENIGVFTRPQGEVGGRGKIGFFMISSLEELSSERFEAASLIKEHFTDDEWGGVNQAFVNEKGQVFGLGHIACFDHEKNRHYYPISFEFLPESNEIKSMKIIAVRDDFPEGAAKRKDLTDVLFSGGLTFTEDGRAELYVGVSDAEAHMAVISDPYTSF